MEKQALNTSSSVTNIILILLGVWLLVLVAVLFTIAKRRDMSMPVKVLWAAIIFIAPVLGLIFYLIFGVKTRSGTRDIYPRRGR